MPYIQLRDIATKSKRADVVALHPQIAAELRRFKPADAKPLDAVLPEVPSMKVMKKDLAFAGIDYKTDDGFADFHAQRLALKMMLASQNIDSRARQVQLRHTDPRLTEVTYFDKQRYIQPQAEKLGQAAAVPTRMPPSAEPPDATGIERKTKNGAQLAHNGGVPTGLFEAQAGTVEVADGRGVDADPPDTQISQESACFWHTKARPGVV